MSSRTKKQDKKLGTTLDYVEWDDHFSVRVAWNVTPDLTPVRVISVGKVIAEDKKVLCLAQNYDKVGNTGGNTISILKNCIAKRKTLRG